MLYLKGHADIYRRLQEENIFKHKHAIGDLATHVLLQNHNTQTDKFICKPLILDE